MERLLAKVPQLLRSHHQLSAKPYANVIFVAFCTSQTLEDKMATNDWKSKTSLHEFSAKDIDGNEVGVDVVFVVVVVLLFVFFPRCR